MQYTYLLLLLLLNRLNSLGTVETRSFSVKGRSKFAGKKHSVTKGKVRV